LGVRAQTRRFRGFFKTGFTMADIDNRYKGLRILVVDDHLLMRSVIMQSLRALGYLQVDTAPGGAEALKLIREKHAAGMPYHIAFLDWHMPEVDGMSVLKACRSEAQFANMAIIMLTAEQERKNVLHAIENGASSYIVKPVSTDSLDKNVQNIIRWLEKRGVTDFMGADAAPAATTDKDMLPEQIQKELRPVIARGMQKIFSNIFNVQIIPEGYVGDDLDNSMMCVGRLHQQGMTITLRFFFDQVLLKPLLRQLYSPQFLADDAVYADAACEIVNILASQVKAFLNGHGYSLSLDLPEVCTKPDLRSKEPVIDIRFSLNEEQHFLVDVTAG
jgi:two-component system chemotaxis response regulator CheY